MIGYHAHRRSLHPEISGTVDGFTTFFPTMDVSGPLTSIVGKNVVILVHVVFSFAKIPRVCSVIFVRKFKHLRDECAGSSRRAASVRHFVPPRAQRNRAQFARDFVGPAWG